MMDSGLIRRRSPTFSKKLAAMAVYEIERRIESK